MAAKSTSDPSQPFPTSMIFTGTGTSGAVPVIGCLTSSSSTKCLTCTSSNPRNHRLNTGAVFVIHDPSTNTSKNLLIDCGKTFYHPALRWSPHHGLRQIDALLLTHAHADAFFGLDDLRSWTLASTATSEPAIQSHVDVYCDPLTMLEVERTFPYLVDRTRATGGGDVPSFVWHVFDPYAGEEPTPFVVDQCGGLRVSPLPVEHGSFMSNGEPFMCMGFRIGDFSYVSDTSSIPDRTRRVMLGSRVVIMDGLKWSPHASHFSIQQGREWVRDELGSGRAERGTPGKKNANSTNGVDGRDGDKDNSGVTSGPERTWLVGFSHNVEHEHATSECEAWAHTEEGQGMWVRPAWDGLRIGPDGAEVTDAQIQSQA